MASMTTLRMACGGLLLSLPFVVSCGDDGGGGGNVLTPTGTGDSSGGASATGPVESNDSADGTSEGTGAPPETMFPATFRFDCMDILAMGDSDGDGMPDADAIQATLLENTWSSDITDFKLNILLTVHEREGDAATLSIGSGIGAGITDQCVEGTTATPNYPAGFEAGAAMWQPSGGADSCIEAATGSAGGTYSFELSTDDTVYIYAEDDDGTMFNCVPGGGAPNAVPLHAIVSTVTIDEAGEVASGEMTGCLVDSEAQALCSCLGECVGAAHEDCGGCPEGGVPLAVLLGSVGPTDNCTALMGETAYDFVAGFVSRRLDDVPMSCGG